MTESDSIGEIIMRKQRELFGVIQPQWQYPDPREICLATASGRHVWRSETVADAIARRYACPCCGETKAPS